MNWRTGRGPGLRRQEEPAPIERVEGALVNSRHTKPHPEESLHEDRISRHWVDG
jgi:hypothetical protein